MKTKETIFFSKEELEKEEWRDVLGYEGIYQVSSLGRIKSLNRYVPRSRNGNMLIKGRIMKLSTNKNNAFYVELKNEFNIAKTRSVAKIVAENFIKNKNNFEYVKHKNGNVSDNRIENLDWYTKIDVNIETNKKRKKTSDYHGVIFDKNKNKFTASVCGKHLGTFKTEEEAVNSRKQYIKKNNINFYYRNKTD